MMRLKLCILTQSIHRRSYVLLRLLSVQVLERPVILTREEALGRVYNLENMFMGLICFHLCRKQVMGNSFKKILIYL